MRKTKCHPQLLHHCRRRPSLNCWQQRKQKQNQKQRAKQRKPTFCVYLADSVPTRAETETCTRRTSTIPFHLHCIQHRHVFRLSLWPNSISFVQQAVSMRRCRNSVCSLMPENQTRAGTENRLDSISGMFYHEMAHVPTAFRQFNACPLALLVAYHILASIVQLEYI